MYERQLQCRNIRLQQSIEVSRHYAVVLFTDNMESSDDNADVAWLQEYGNIVNPSATGSFANSK